ncbi:MAG: hypothetical protein ACON3Z_10080 [Bradymonadia bacterium]
MKSLIVLILLAAPIAAAQTPDAQTDGTTKSLSANAELTAALAEIPTDPRPEAITRDMHYTISNETRHYLFKSPIDNIGGVHIGVGAEQNYIFAGWSKPEALVLMDFDQWIVDLHQVYGVFFSAAETPEAFVKLWVKNSRKLLKEKLEDKKAARRALMVFKYSFERVSRHLKKLVKQYKKSGIPIFLTDQGQYDYLRNLYATGRVRSVRGDLTAKKTMKGIGEFARKVNLPVRTLYLSNAEYYFPYRQGRYRDNINGLPFDDTSKVLHTFPYGGVHYYYMYQTGPNFQAWLKSKRVSSLRSLVKKARKLDDKDLRVVDTLPEPKVQ